MEIFKFPNFDNLEDVPEKYRPYYVEVEGGYGVDPKLKPLVDDYVGVSTALAGARNDKKKANDESATRRQALTAFDELANAFGVEVGEAGVAEAIKTFVTELQDQVKGGKQMKIDLDKIRGTFEKEKAELTATKDKEIAQRDAAISKYLIGNVAAGALAKHKGSIELLSPIISSRAEVIREDNGEYSVRIKDDEGTHRMNASGGWMNIDELVTELKSDSKYARAFESESPGGTGSLPGAMRKSPLNNNGGQKRDEMSATQKIGAGLRKGQYTGAGAGRNA